MAPVTRERFIVPVLVTLDDNSEELRRVEVEAWSLSEAIRLAEEQACEGEGVVEVKAQIR